MSFQGSRRDIELVVAIRKVVRGYPVHEPVLASRFSQETPSSRRAPLSPRELEVSYFIASGLTRPRRSPPNSRLIGFSTVHAPSGHPSYRELHCGRM